MVSRVRYFSFKEYDFLRAHPVRTMVTFLFLLALVVSLPRLFGFLLCAIYIAGGLVYTFVILPRRNRQLLRAYRPRAIKAAYGSPPVGRKTRSLDSRPLRRPLCKQIYLVNPEEYEHAKPRLFFRHHLA